MGSLAKLCTRPHLSAREEALLDNLLSGLRLEYERPLDEFSQDVLVAQLDVLLSHANRFYHRQFLTRRTAGHDLLSRFEALLSAYFTPGAEARKPCPLCITLPTRCTCRPLT